ncbi:IS5 family transposase [Heliobacterium mobile]|uniref:IS5 family transposase n=1 Tax=Heliobacterium mobile TaxID=28064 RepID=UPI001F331D9D|nr:IS5 family transposase [Heliobacterium mobile]
MYRKNKSEQLYIEDFILPFAGKLRADNRWVKLSKIIPWDVIEEKYASQFPSHTGRAAYPVRMALGALIIKEKCGYTDRETVAQIAENPYLQYFIGLGEYQDESPFDASLMVHFRKRFDEKTLQEINEWIAQETNRTDKKDDDENQGPSSGAPQQEPEETLRTETEPLHEGKLILDATCAPADIRYPNDLSLLNEAREKLDAIIDTLYKEAGVKRPRTYRQIARKHYLSVTKQKKPQFRKIRKAIGKQLRFVARNLRIVHQFFALIQEAQGQSPLRSRQKKDLEVIRELYQQQRDMYTHKTHRVERRIVSIHQPHVRPIVRGKAKAAVEFGAKVAISLVNGYTRIEKLGWEPFNEGNTLIESVEAYLRRHGHYPEVIQADKIYQSRENLQYCKRHGIRLSGPKLGRPSTSEKMTKEQIRLEKLDSRERNAVEGKFGEGKRRYGLGRIMARLGETAATVIGLQVLVMNLEHKLRLLFAILAFRSLIYIKRYMKVELDLVGA